MYPEDYNYQQPMQPVQRSKKPLAIIVIVFGVLVLGLITWLAFKPSAKPGEAPATSDSSSVKDPGYKLSASSLKANVNFATVQGTDIYAYDGAAFFKQSLVDNGQLTILSQGVKLPRPSSITWVGSKGALMTFQGSYLGTSVYDALRAQRLIPNATTMNYVWYFDFASGSITQFSQSALAVNSVAMAASDAGFYYLGPVSQSSSKEQRTPLSYFDTAARKSLTISNDVGITNITSLVVCGSGKLCVVGKDATTSTQTKLYSVDAKQGTKQTLSSATGRIFSTNDPTKYVTADSGTEQGAAYSQQSTSGGKNQTNDTDVPTSTAKLYDVSSKSTDDLGFLIGLNTIFPSFDSAGNFIVLDNSYNASQPRTGSVANLVPGYRAGTVAQGSTSLSKLFPLVTTDNKPFTTTTINAAYGTDRLLVTDVNQAQFVLAKEQPPVSLVAQELKTANNLVDSCLTSAGAGSSSEYDVTTSTYEIFLTYDANFARNIRNFTSCVSAKGSAGILGYNYKFSGRDAVNGRLVTD